MVCVAYQQNTLRNIHESMNISSRQLFAPFLHMHVLAARYGIKNYISTRNCCIVVCSFSSVVLCCQNITTPPNHKHVSGTTTTKRTGSAAIVLIFLPHFIDFIVQTSEQWLSLRSEIVETIGDWAIKTVWTHMTSLEISDDFFLETI